MDKIQKLEREILKHKALYYQGRPIISDVEYDQLEEELKKHDPKNPVLSVVGSLSTNTDKIKHDKKMLSLEKTYVVEDLISWANEREVLSTFKVDGISCSIIYKNGELLLGKTRGDGSFGENITSKILWISKIPKHLSGKFQNLEIRGELFCHEEDFFHLSNEMEQLGLERPTSQRNIVAGLMGRKENLELCRYISFQSFDVITDEVNFKKEEEKFKILNELGFELPVFEVHRKATTIQKAIEEAKEFMSEGDYQIDGLVFTYNEIKLHEELGETAHHPRYKIAFKFQGEVKQTTIKEITWQVSRNGILTPVAEVEPVELSGAVIKRVTLHNFGMVKQHNLKCGDRIEIIRSGEVIPKFLSVVESGSFEFQAPLKCPSCGEMVRAEEIRIYCDNESCPDKTREELLNFVQKIGIEDLSEKRLEELLTAKMIAKISDLFKLTIDDLLKLEKVKEKLATKLIENISKVKKTDLITFLSSLGISGGAFSKCEKVVYGGFDTIEKIKKITIEDLMKIEGFAEKSSQEFYESLKSKYSLIDELVKAGFEFEVQEKKETKISGKKICITGALSEKREAIEDRIRLCGGIVVSSVSKNTDLLVTNETDSTSSKYKKALELKIQIITEQDLKNLMEG